MSCIDPPHVHATKKAAPMQAPVDVVVFTDRHHMYSMLNLAGITFACCLQRTLNARYVCKVDAEVPVV